MIGFFPFYSFLTLDGVYLIAGLTAIFLYSLVSKKQASKKGLFGLGIFILMYIIAEYGLIQSLLFNSQFVSHRSDWNLYYLSVPINSVIRNVISMFLHGQYHASSHHELIFFISLLAIIILSNKEARKKKISSI